MLRHINNRRNNLPFFVSSKALSLLLVLGPFLPACVPCGQGGGLMWSLPRGLVRRRLHDDGMGALRPRLGGGPGLVCGVRSCALCMAAFILRRLRIRSTLRHRHGYGLAGREGRALGGRMGEGRSAVGVSLVTVRRGRGLLRCRLGLLRRIERRREDGDR